MKKLLFIVITLIGLIPLGRSQAVWTLNQCLDSATSNNILIRQQALDAQAANRMNKQAYWDFSPAVNASLGSGYSFGRNIDPITNEFTQTSRQNSNFNLSGNWSLFTGMQRYHAINYSKLTILAQEEEEKIITRNVRLQVVTFYLQCLLSQEMAALAVQHKVFSEAQKTRLEQMIKAGIRTDYDLMEVNAQLANDELNYQRAVNDFKLSMVQLKGILQLENVQDFTIDTTMRILEDTSVFIGIDQLPEIKQSEITIQQAKINRKMSQSAYFPSLTFFAGIGSGYSDSYFITGTDGMPYVPSFSTQFNENLYQSLSINLSIPIFNGHQTRTNEQLNQIETERAILQKEQLIWDMKNTIGQLELDIANAQSELELALKNMDAAQQDFNQAELRYDNGNLTYIELLAKKDRLFNAQSNLVQSKYNYYFKRKILTLYNE